MSLITVVCTNRGGHAAREFGVTDFNPATPAAHDLPGRSHHLTTAGKLPDGTKTWSFGPCPHCGRNPVVTAAAFTALLASTPIRRIYNELDISYQP